MFINAGTDDKTKVHLTTYKYKLNIDNGIDNYSRKAFDLEIEFTDINGNNYEAGFFNSKRLNTEEGFNLTEWDGGLVFTKNSTKLQEKSISNDDESADISLMIEF